MDILQTILNLVVPVMGLSILLLLWPALTIRSIFLRFFNAVFEENMRGKVVLITGASSGIGEHIAYQYSKRGAVIVLIARREEKLRTVADNCVRYGAMDVRAIRADVSNEDDCRKFIEDTINQYGRLDHLVNNAGVIQSFLFEEAHDTIAMNDIMATDFWGYVYPTFYALEHLKQSKGRIIVIASVASWLPHPRMSIYNASKAAVFNFFDTLRIELRASIGGITIVTPAYIESEMLMGKLVTGEGNVKLQERQRDVHVGPAPIACVEECAKDIVRGAVRGLKYVRTPYWSTTFLLYRVFTPELVDFMMRLFYLVPMPGRKGRAPLSKVLLEIPGVKALLYPPGVNSVQQNN